MIILNYVELTKINEKMENNQSSLNYNSLRVGTDSKCAAFEKISRGSREPTEHASARKSTPISIM